MIIKDKKEKVDKLKKKKKKERGKSEKSSPKKSPKETSQVEEKKPGVLLITKTEKKKPKKKSKDKDESHQVIKVVEDESGRPAGKSGDYKVPKIKLKLSDPSPPPPLPPSKPKLTIKPIKEPHEVIDVIEKPKKEDKKEKVIEDSPEPKSPPRRSELAVIRINKTKRGRPKVSAKTDSESLEASTSQNTESPPKPPIMKELKSDVDPPPSPEMAKFAPLTTEDRAGRAPRTGRPPSTVQIASDTASAKKGSPGRPPKGRGKAGVPSSAKKSKTPGKDAKDDNVVLITETVGSYIDDDGQKIWICPACGRQDDGSPMIGCDECDDWYHWVCVSIRVAPDDDENWYCSRCLAKNQTLVSRMEKQKKKKKTKKS